MTRYLFEYSRQHDPAAPIIEVVIKSGIGTTDPVSAFIDSGADGTMIPLALLQGINARYADKRILSGVTGEPTIIGLYPVLLQIGENTIYGIEAAGYGDEVILGRDVLNQIRLVLDGPALAIEIDF